MFEEIKPLTLATSGVRLLVSGIGMNCGMTGISAKDASTPTILIVDDEMDMRIFMRTLFETNGFQPVVVPNGKEGIAKAKGIHPDLIILDVMMPGEGGALMYKALKGDPDLRHIPVIMCSAVAETTFQHYLKMLNARFTQPVPDPEAYVEKPPEPDVLLALAKKVMDHG